VHGGEERVWGLEGMQRGNTEALGELYKARRGRRG
jgi:hypothetical protein